MRHTEVGQFSSTCKCHLENSMHKIKRLKSRKERSQKRSGGQDPCRVNSQQHGCCLQGNLDIRHLHTCSQNTCKRDLVSPPPVPVTRAPTQEASLITASRLISHRGIFNHQVKSLDIQRLLLDKKERTTKEAKTSSPLFNDASGPHEEPQATEAAEESKEKSQTSEVILDQREKEPSLLITSDESPVVKRTITRPGPKLPSSVECSPERKKLPEPRKPPSLIRRRHVAMKTGVDSPAQKEGIAPKSVSAVARRLCNSLRFPLLRQRDLVAESREVLLRALREAHGKHLQQNLKHLHSGTDLHPQPKGDVHKQKAKRKKRQWTPAPFPVDSGHDIHFKSEGNALFENKRKGKKHLRWDLSSPPQQRLDQTTAWPTSPVDTSTGHLDEIFRLRTSPEFHIDFSPSPTVTHQLFIQSKKPPVHFFGETHTKFEPFGDCYAQQSTSWSQPSYIQISPGQELKFRYSPGQHIPLKNDASFERQEYPFTPIFSSHALFSPPGHHYMQPYILESPSPIFTSMTRPKRWPFSPRKLY
ncbi:uncharacterized protein si:dkey-250k15.4 [Corythoichthys intestinalis]|uniref:uncharacterized protein si:dkey-250k15.4 n=1 Tax=Corythoichthys intestinalis TaxID=161448 RepID=UPI0025A5C57A|nr:uncharacterized protein si:dkey-250k15.4 [Corythoichthys intestinalis]XP_057689972.1 uncharacterized protein si:dkey-250k15.4 [Corythoichthys intestinalis]